MHRWPHVCYFACLHPCKQLHELRLSVFLYQLSSTTCYDLFPSRLGSDFDARLSRDPARLATPGTPAVAVPTAAGPHPLQQPLETLLALPSDWLR